MAFEARIKFNRCTYVGYTCVTHKHVFTVGR